MTAAGGPPGGNTTGRGHAARRGTAPGPRAGWQSARSELIIAAGTVLAATAGAYAFDGSTAAAVVLAGAGLVAMVLLRSLTRPHRMPGLPPEEWQATGRSVITGFWRKRGMLADATSATGNYDFELRDTLQHLLAAALAERHGVSLYADPGRARQLLAGTRYADLWPWLDPEREAPPGHKGGGIPPRTLAAIIDRLEHL